MLNIRKRSKTLPDERRQVELEPGDVILHRGMLIDAEVLDAILSTGKRLLWALCAERRATFKPAHSARRKLSGCKNPTLCSRRTLRSEPLSVRWLDGLSNLLSS